MDTFIRFSALATATIIASGISAPTSFASDTSDGASEQEAAAEAITERLSRNTRLARPAGTNAQAIQLVADAQQGLRAVGIDNVNPAMLSLGTVQRLSQVFSERDGNPHAAALAILEEAPRRTRLMRTVAEVPAAESRAMIVVRDVRSLGISVVDPGALTLGQLLQISAELDHHEGTSDRAAAVNRILGM